MTRSIAVVGGGIVGVAVARALARRGDEVTVLEKEHRLARHQTGHNSGVVHAGLYYAPGSLKATLCAAGRVALHDYCLEKDLPYRELGKLVVAVDESELPALAEIERRARANGVPDLRRLDGAAALREIEPHVAGVAAVHSPRTAVVDYAAVTEAMAQDVRAAGGRVLLGHEVTGLTPAGLADRVRVVTPGLDEAFDRVVVCAGLQSDVVARLVGADPSPRILPFRGEYWTLAPDRASLVRGMVYPVPDPRFPFLGVHFTRGVYDAVHVGPNAVPALRREGTAGRRSRCGTRGSRCGGPGRVPSRGSTGAWGSTRSAARCSSPCTTGGRAGSCPSCDRPTWPRAPRQESAPRRGRATGRWSTTSPSTRSAP